jgi:protein TonB
MKLIVALVILSVPIRMFAQQISVKKDTIYNVKDVDKAPEYPGGTSKLLQPIRYPTEARENNIEGKVIVQFIVNEKGALTDIKVIQSVGGGCDEEVLRVLNLKKKWKPAIKNGIPVNVYVQLPVNFKLGVE